MKLSELKSDEPVTYRVGRAGDSKVDWGPWQTGPMYLVRRIADMPSKYRKRCKYWKAGDIVTITPATQGWAEYNQADFFDGTFTAEDYYMEIKGLSQ